MEFAKYILLLVGLTGTLSAQELRIEYPEIRLADKRVLVHAKVESFNGLAFCISHNAGIEASVAWEIMPAAWQRAFPRDPQLALKIHECALAGESKSPLPPIDLKKQTGHGRPSAGQSDSDNEKAEAAKLRAAFDFAASQKQVMVGMTAEQCLRAWGKPHHVNKTINGAGTREQWVYRSGYLYLNDGVLTSASN